ncbi:hypothetical protein SAMN05216436_11086 [bacterium A37T11]|nr:hypothetical protein SAMN05216436_11086 [bacterium A37T11]
MNTSTLREKLHQLINNASDENLPSIYQAVDAAAVAGINWWENKDVIREFDDRVKSWLDRGEVGYTMDDIDNEINKRQI